MSMHLPCLLPGGTFSLWICAYSTISVQVPCFVGGVSTTNVKQHLLNTLCFLVYVPWKVTGHILEYTHSSGGTCPHNLTLNNIILKPYFHVCSFCFSPQLAYLAWVTSVKTALKERQRHQRHLKSIERKEKEKEKQGRVDLQQEVFSAAG